MGTYDHRFVFPLVHVSPYVVGQREIYGVDGAERRFQYYRSGGRRGGGAGRSGAEHAYGRGSARSGRRAAVVRRRFGTLVQRSVEQAPGAAHHSQSVHVVVFVCYFLFEHRDNNYITVSQLTANVCYNNRPVITVVYIYLLGAARNGLLL